MDKEYLVYQNKVYSNFVNYINDYILLSEDPEMLKEDLEALKKKFEDNQIQVDSIVHTEAKAL